MTHWPWLTIWTWWLATVTTVASATAIPLIRDKVRERRILYKSLRAKGNSPYGCVQLDEKAEREFQLTGTKYVVLDCAAINWANEIRQGLKNQRVLALLGEEESKLLK